MGYRVYIAERSWKTVANGKSRYLVKSSKLLRNLLNFACVVVFGPDFEPFSNFPIFREKWNSGGNLGRHLLEKFSSRSWIRTGVFRILRSTKSTTAS